MPDQEMVEFGADVLVMCYDVHRTGASRERLAEMGVSIVTVEHGITAGGSRKGGQQHERLFRSREVEHDVPAVSQPRIVHARRPETQADLVGKRLRDGALLLVWQAAQRRAKTSCAARVSGQSASFSRICWFC